MSKKICLLVASLSSGGAEKVAANMSVTLTKIGYDITTVSMTNFIDYKYEGKLYNFGLVKEKNNRLSALFKFKQYFKNHKFDYIIDHRTRVSFFKELLFSKYIFRNCRIIYCVHNYHLAYYFSFLNIPKLSRLPHTKKRVFVSVSDEIKQHLKQKLNIESQRIYNFLNKNELSNTSNNNPLLFENYIIGVGRLTPVKQFDKLIKSYSTSGLSKKNINLVIMGNGPEKKNLEGLIKKLNLEKSVKLLPFQKNPFKHIKNAKALVLTSKFEGFPMVLLEALTLNTPIIAFNCKSGPSEIIKNNINGFLVKNQNEVALTKALNTLLLDDVYYASIKKNTQEGLDKFSENYIIQEWVNILENHT